MNFENVNMGLINNIITDLKWTKSTNNQDISLHRSVEFTNNPILIIGGVHGDEPEGVYLSESLLHWLKNNQLPLRDWALIPCLNPDGIKKQHRTNGNNVSLETLQHQSQKQKHW